MLRHAFSSPKLAALCRRLKIPRGYAVGVLESLWFFTATQAPRGDIGRWSNEEIASALDVPIDPDELIAGLVATRWLDACQEHRLVVHDWSDHCDQNVRRTPQVRSQGFATASNQCLTSESPVRHQSDTGDSRDSLTPEPEPEPVEPIVADAAPPPRRSPLLNLLSKREGSEREKVLWLEDNLDVIEAEADGDPKKVRSLVVRWYRAYLARDTAGGERAYARAARRERERAASEAERARLMADPEVQREIAAAENWSRDGPSGELGSLFVVSSNGGSRGR